MKQYPKEEQPFAMLDIYFLLLGKEIYLASFSQFLTNLKISPQVEKFDDCYYLIFQEIGISMLFDHQTDKLSTIFFHVQPHEKFGCYKDSLPLGIHASDTRRKVRAHLGKPFETGGGRYLRLLDRVIDRWDTYHVQGVAVNISYDHDSNMIKQVTLELNTPTAWRASREGNVAGT